MPALYNLLDQGILPDRFFIVGVARRQFSDNQFRQMMKEAVVKYSRGGEIKEGIWEKLAKNIFYQQGLFEEEAPYNDLIPRLSQFDKEVGACITRFFYLATPPQNYATILSHLNSTKLSEGCGSPFVKTTGDKEVSVGERR